MKPSNPTGAHLYRREFIRGAGAMLAAGLVAPRVASAADTVTLPFEHGLRPLVRYPGKRPLIRLTSRPPQLETPFQVFNEGLLTPNDAFFVRYHLAGIPLSIDPDTFTVEVGGTVGTPLRLSLKDIKTSFEPVEIVAVNQCSGNSRGFMKPRVGGGQLGNGAMGNARWRGARLKDVLDRAGVASGARQVVFNGLDHAVIEATPDFVKALDIDHARDGEVMLAYSMNGEDIPMLNGFPLRLVVPGYYGTYWVKHLNQITVVENVYDGFWMNPAYRIPDTPNGSIAPGTAPKSTIPINRFNVRSFITSLADGATVRPDRAIQVRGIAFDGGSGIAKVEFSSDGGRGWREAALGSDLGNYSFREWTISFTPPASGRIALQSRATSRAGQVQPLEPGWNPAGYMRNVVETVNVLAVS